MSASPTSDYATLFDLTGKTAVVTGGAGILGQEFCAALAGHGANVAVLDVDHAAAENVAPASAAKLAAKLKADVIGIGKSIASTTPNSVGDGRSYKGTVVIDV